MSPRSSRVAASASGEQKSLDRFRLTLAGYPAWGGGGGIGPVFIA